MIKTFSAPLLLPGNDNLTFSIYSPFKTSLFELSYPFKIESLFLVPKYSLTTSMMLSLLPFCVPRRWDFSFGNREKSEGGNHENIWDEEGFQINIQSQQSWQLVTCGQGRCPERAEHLESVFLASFRRFQPPHFACIICIVYCATLLNHDHPLTIPKN